MIQPIRSRRKRGGFAKGDEVIPEDRRRLVCFVHVEKAAGMTLHGIFRNNWPAGYLTLTPWELWSNEPGSELTPGELRWLLNALPWTRGVGGHTVRSYLGYGEAVRRPVAYVTVLRDPVSRYISHYNYQREVMGKGWTIESFLREPRFDNFMTRRIAGSSDVERAKRELRDRFSFVGLVERYDESLLLMRDRLGLPGMDLRYQRENARSSPAPAAGVPDSREVRDRIREANSLDLELYRFVRRVLFPQYVDGYAGDLRRDLDGFQRRNRFFRFDPVRRFWWRAYRHLGYRHLERIARMLHR